MFDPLELGWLPQPPVDFRQTVRAIRAGDGAVLQRLAGYRLDSLQCGLFNRALARVRVDGGNPAPLSPLRLTLLSNATVDLIADALPVAAARHGVALEITVVRFDQVLQEALNPASQLHASRADAILLLLDHRWYGLGSPDPGHPERVGGALDRLTEVLDGIQAINSVPVILQTLPVPSMPLFGSYDRCVPGSMRDLDALNAAIVELKRTRGCYLLDAAAICDIIGSARFHDPVAWNLYKLPMAREAVPLYADWVGRLLGAIRGKGRKCLVLDLDNTLWGGIIGDDSPYVTPAWRSRPAGDWACTQVEG